MIYYAGSVFVVLESGVRMRPLVWHFQAETIDSFKTQALATAIEAYGPATVVEFGTIGVSRLSHK